MDRHELDLTDTDVLEVSITQSGGIVNVYIRTKDEVIELVMDAKGFAILKDQIKSSGV